MEERWKSMGLNGRMAVISWKLVHLHGSVTNARGWKRRTGSRWEEYLNYGQRLSVCRLEAFCGDLSHNITNYSCTGLTLPTTTPTASTPPNTLLNLPTNPHKASVYRISLTISVLLLSNLDTYSSPKASSTQITTYYIHGEDSCRRFCIFL